MSAAGTLRAVEVLRREIQVAALTGKTEAMRNINVVVADVGSFNVGPPTHFLPPEDVYKAMEGWSVSEKITYGPGFAAMAQQSITPKSKWETFTGYFQNDAQYGVARKPTDVKVFVDSIVGVVSNGQFGWSFLGFNLCFGVVRNWLRGERFSVGAGGEYIFLFSHSSTDAALYSTHIQTSFRPPLSDFGYSIKYPVLAHCYAQRASPYSAIRPSPSYPGSCHRATG